MEKTDNAGFRRVTVDAKKLSSPNREKQKHHSGFLNEHLYMKLMLGNRKCLWLPIGISPDLLKSYIQAVTEEI